MPLNNPRSGESYGFSAYSATSDEGTLGNVETIIWSSIRHLCSRGVAEYIAANFHGITRKRDLQAVARNLKLYVSQAHEFYQAAQAAKPNTAPLIYYYSFLNLAKARCEIRCPGFHKRAECYGHGISWRPKKDYLVNLETEMVSVTSWPGVWHVLWESLTQQPYVALPKSVRLRIKDLFLYCPEISVEAGRAFSRDSQLISLIEPDILRDEAAQEAWIRFSLHRGEIKFHHMTIPGVLKTLATDRSGFTEVRQRQAHLRTFESTLPIATTQEFARTLNADLRGMNVFCHLDRGGNIEYAIPIQHRLPIRMPQLVVLYTILLWLGSLVRYDPHSVSELMESHHWSLIDGFMSQSRLWLPELFEWDLYQAETTLWSAR
jgi:YaaC-like Protein